MKPPALRQEEAKAREAERAKRTPQEQLARWDRKYGKGVGCKKERARLAKLIQGQNK